MTENTPSLADAIASVQSDGQKRCPVARLLVTMPAADAETLRVALADAGLSAAQIARALGAIGIQIGYGTIKHHRGNRCSCGS